MFSNYLLLYKWCIIPYLDCGKWFDIYTVSWLELELHALFIKRYNFVTLKYIIVGYFKTLQR